MENALYTGKPASAGADETHRPVQAVGGRRVRARIQVRLGRTSVSAVEVLGGLREGDRVILSDMSEWDHVDRIQLE